MWDTGETRVGPASGSARPIRPLDKRYQSRAGPRRLGDAPFAPQDGHLSLMSLAGQHAAHLIVSIFVNPTQFGHHEDYHRHPGPIEENLARCGTQTQRVAD